VLFTLMADESTDGLTASELGARAGASAAAISGAVRYLQKFDLVERRAVRGSRSDRYRLSDDAWYTAGVSESRMYPMLIRSMR